MNFSSKKILTLLFSLLTLVVSAVGVHSVHAVGPKMYVVNPWARTISVGDLDGTYEDSLDNPGGLLNLPAGIALDTSNNQMYLVQDIGNIIRANLDGTGAVDLGTLDDNLNHPADLVLDLVHGKIYVTNTNSDSIIRANLDGTGVEDLGNLNGLLHRPDDIALDLANNKMYILNYVDSHVIRANLDGTGVEDLGNPGGLVSKPWGFALDLINGRMYITCPETDPQKIVRANLDGSGAISLGDLNGTVNFPTHLAIDAANNKMYIVSKNNETIVRANLDGTGAVSLGDLNGTLSEPYTLALDLDITPPAAPVVTAPTGATNDATPTIGGTAEANALVNVWYRDLSNTLVQICTDVRVSGSGAWSCISSVTLPEGPIQLTIRATDGTGNTGSAAMHSFTVDLTAPAAPAVNAPVGSTNDSTPTISGTAEASSKINVWYQNGTTWQPICANVSGNGFGAWSCESSVTLPAGTMELKVNATDAVGNQSADTSHSFTVKLSVPTVTSIVRASANPTSAASVNFIVTFSEAVFGVTANDFSLYPTGTVTGANIQSVNGSDNTYTITVNTGAGYGTLRLDVPNTATITDLAGNALGSLPFTTGEMYTIARNNGADTTGVFRPSNGLLYLKNKNDTGFADAALNYGLPGDYPVVGDWDGNGDVTIGIYRNGTFYLRNENTIGFATVVFDFGQPGDQPIAGDWDGDGVDTIGVYRPSNGQFLLRNSNTPGDAEMSFYLGNVGDVGVAGDWNGDGKDTTGVFRPSNGMIFLKNTNDTGYADIALNYGLPGDKPVMGDWDNDGIDTIGIYRNGTFYLRNENTNGFAEIVFGLGNPGDHPMAGNWDGIP